MTQTYEQTSELKSQESKEPELQTPIECETDELLGDLNPRYFEEAYSLEDAKNRVKASGLGAGSNNAFFGGF